MGRFAAIQMTSSPDVAATLAAAADLLAEAHGRGADVALLPENFAFMGRGDADKRAVAERLDDGPIQAFLAAQAQRLGLWILGGTLPLASGAADGRVTNTVLAYDAGGRRVGRYDKIHLFDVDLPDQRDRYRESAHVRPGSEIVVIDTPAGRVGASVSYDLRFPEHDRRLAARGAEVLVVPSAFTVPTGRAHWETLLRARAIENLCYVAAAAQSGVHPDVGPGGRETYGDSLIVDWWGRVVTRLPRGSGAVVADVDVAALRRARETFPALSHRVLDAPT
ncbi:MAG: carbon-nitrogen hydrolase family protein [Pseudomonadota bacterium]